jgi:hypothetical protein
MSTPTGYWTEGTVNAQGTNIGGGQFVQGTAPQSYTNQVNTTGGTTGATQTNNWQGTPIASTPIYNAPTTGGMTTTTPVVTAKNAQDDYIAKFNAYNTLSQQISQQSALKATQAQLDAQKAAQEQLQASETNLKQQGIDIQKTQALAQQKEAQAKMDLAKSIDKGNETTPITNTSTIPAPQTTPQTTTGAQNTNIQGTTSTTSDQTNALTTRNQELANIQSQKDPVVGQIISLLQSVMAGTIPLTAPQQALISSLQTQLSQNESMQTQANNAYTGQVTQAAFRSGGEYTPAQMAGTIQNAVSVGVARIQQLDNSAAKTIADLEQSFQQKNYDVINKQYDILTKQLDDKAAAVKDTYDTSTKLMQDQRDWSLKIAEFNETVFKDNASIANSQYEFRDLKDEMGNTIGTQVWSKATGKPISSSYNAGQTNPTTGATTPTVATNPDGSVDKKSQYDVLQSVVPKPYQALVWSIVNGKGEAPNTRTKYGMQLASWVTQVDPTLSDGSGGFDATKYQARLTMQKSLANYTGGSYGSGVISANKVIAHLASFLNASASLPGKGAVNPLNVNKLSTGLFGAISSLVGDTSTQSTEAQSEQQAKGLTDEMAKFFKGTGATDVESIKSWGSSLNPYASPGTLQGTVQGTLDLFSGQLDSFIQQYTTVMGHEPDMGTIIQPQTMQTLSAFKNVGYNIDIPGVYYTDKTAWQNSGGTEQQWHSAVDTLTQLGKPLTDENILQAAQVMNE